MSRRPPGDTFESAAPTRNLSSPYPRYQAPMQGPAAHSFQQYSTYQSPFQMPAPFQAPYQPAYQSYGAPSTAALVSFKEGIQIVDDDSLGATANTSTDPRFISYNGAKSDTVPGLGASISPDPTHPEEDILDAEVTTEDLHGMIERNLNQNTRRGKSLTGKLDKSHPHHHESEEDTSEMIKKIRHKLDELKHKHDHKHHHHKHMEAPMQDTTPKTNGDIIQDIREKLERLQSSKGMQTPLPSTSEGKHDSIDIIRKRLDEINNRYEKKSTLDHTQNNLTSRANRLTSGALSSLIRA